MISFIGKNLCFCLCCNTISSIEYDEQFLNNLVLNPEQININLDKKIADWQDAINDYQAYEEICMDENKNIHAFIDHLRLSPNDYINKKKYSTNIISLAVKRCKVNELEKKLGFASTLDSSNSSRYCCFLFRNKKSEHPSSSSLKNNNDDDIRSSALSISDKLSHTW